MSGFKFLPLGLASILKQGRLVVPPNQRNYSWTKEEVVTLLQDFNRSIRSRDATYFVGMIVTIRKDGNVLEVVDGQQRLATTAILLAEIHNYLEASGEDVLCQSIQEFLFTVDRERKQRVPRLELNLDDNSYFHERLTRKQSTLSAVKPSRRLLEHAFTEINTQVKQIISDSDNKDYDETLNQWIDFLEYRAVAVVLEVPSEADAYRMFETLNDRGLRTTQADLVKNYLFGRASTRISEIKNSWSEMQGALRTIKDEDLTIQFLRHALTVKRGIVRENDVHEVVQSVTKGPQEVTILADQFAAMAATYVAIYNADHKKWNNFNEAKKAIKVFNLVEVKPMRPLILAIAEKIPKGEIDQTMSLCVSAAIRLMVTMKTRTGNVEKGFANAARETYSGKIITAKDLHKELSSFIPSDVEFQQQFATARVSNPKLARYYLRSLESAMDSVAQPWYIPNDNSGEIDLEHVLPKKTEGHWPRFSEEEKEQYYKRIGNLCLLKSSDNSTLKSAPYKDKKHVYKNSDYILTKQISEVDEWTTEAIEKRQIELSKLAVKTWQF